MSGCRLCDSGTRIVGEVRSRLPTVRRPSGLVQLSLRRRLHHNMHRRRRRRHRNTRSLRHGKEEPVHARHGELISKSRPIVDRFPPFGLYKKINSTAVTVWVDGNGFFIYVENYFFKSLTSIIIIMIIVALRHTKSKPFDSGCSNLPMFYFIYLILMLVSGQSVTNVTEAVEMWMMMQYGSLPEIDDSIIGQYFAISVRSVTTKIV